MQWLPRNARYLRTEFVASLLVVMTLACERSTPATGQKDTAVPVVPPPESSVVTVPEQSTWDSAAGPALFVAGSTPREALVIAPRYTQAAALDSMQPDRSPAAIAAGRPVRGWKETWYRANRCDRSE